MSDDSLGYEPIDDELRRRLGAAGPQPGDPDATLGALRPRYRRAKRRHQLVVAGGTAVAVVAILGVGTAVLGTGGSDPQRVRVPAANSSVPNGATSTTSPPNGAPTAPPNPTTTPGTGGSDKAGTGTTGSTTATSTAPAEPTTHTYTSSGGSVVVKLDNGALSIVSTQPASGYTEERHDTGPDRVEVRFTNDTGEWRIRVDLVNGEAVEQTTQN